MAEKQFYEKGLEIEDGVTSLGDKVIKLKEDAEKLYELENAHFSSLMSMEELQLSKLEENRRIAEETRVQAGLIVDGLNQIVPKFQMLVELFIGLNNSLIFTKSLVATTAIFQLIMVFTLNILSISIGYVTGFLDDGLFIAINLGITFLSFLYPLVVIYLVKQARKNMIDLNNKQDEEGAKDDKSNS